MRYLFTMRQASGVFARALVDNPRSQAVARRCGMTECLRAAVAEHDPPPHPTCVHYAMARDQWGRGRADPVE
jgi:RimJ/RimL family protein N-acetyltransferase